MIQAAELAGFNFREISSTRIGVSLDETTTDEELRSICRVFGAEPTGGRSGIPSKLLREMDYLSHPLFSDYRTETEMLRYLKRLENKDISLTRAMIPLGSCTMKLNAAAEMIPVSGLNSPVSTRSRRNIRWRATAPCSMSLPRGLPSARAMTPCRYSPIQGTGRVRRINGDQALPPGSWRSAPEYMSHPNVSAWNEPGECGNGGHDGCVGEL